MPKTRSYDKVNELKIVYVYIYIALYVYTDIHNIYLILWSYDAKKFKIQSYKDKYHGPCLWVHYFSEDPASEECLGNTCSENGPHSIRRQKDQEF